MSLEKLALCAGSIGIFLGVGCGQLPKKGNILSANLSNFEELPPCVDDDCNCNDFNSQASAQVVLNAFPTDPFVLDKDQNGYACETLPLEATAESTEGLQETDSRPTESIHLSLGNPSNAATGTRNNHLLVRGQYALSYHADRGTANWVAWQLTADWLGNTERQNNFRQDGVLPSGSYQVTPSDYVNTGFDRGHIVPSADRTRSIQDNSATFLMTNVWPQAPENNRGVWRELEEYSRDWVERFDYTLFILAGGYGKQTQIAEGQVTVPSRLWKIIVFLEPEQTIDEIDSRTMVVAVDMPNRDGLGDDWRDYQTTVDRIEVATGYDFLSVLSSDVQAVVEARVSSDCSTPNECP
ncbi:MAG: DNA/RNA non-specific endonuclease [Leptolyngbyaceae cyanobacterium]